MSTAVAIGDARRLGGFALGGVEVIAAMGPDEVQAAWEVLPHDTALVILSPDALEHLGSRLHERSDIVWVVLPE